LKGVASTYELAKLATERVATLSELADELVGEKIELSAGVRLLAPIDHPDSATYT
jgi:hypothetical protein